jgi:hypothetical protein
MTSIDKDAQLRFLREGLNYLPDSTEKRAAVIVDLYSRSLARMHRDGLLPAEQAIDELRTLYKAVEAAHPGQWEALGGPLMPAVLTA